jgi:diguanylate cyclase (GGDEF)-like protein
MRNFLMEYFQISNENRFMDNVVRILILDDIAADAELIENEVRQVDLSFRFLRVDNRESFLRALHEYSPDLILSDYKIPSFGGLEALLLAKKHCPEAPFILVSGAIGEEFAVDIMKKGATDYVLKSRLFRLAPAVERALREARERIDRKKAQEVLKETLDELELRVHERTNELAETNKQLREEIEERERIEKKLREFSETDPLTMIYNRRKLLDVMVWEIEKARRYSRRFSVVMFDLDDFKNVNDRFGHDAGDVVLKTTAGIVGNIIRKTDILARYGGEEFIILCPDVGLAGAEVLAERMRKSIEECTFPAIRRLTVSVGVAEYSPEDSAEAVIKRADEALYAAKRKGKNRVEASGSSAHTRAAGQASE